MVGRCEPLGGGESSGTGAILRQSGVCQLGQGVAHGLKPLTPGPVSPAGVLLRLAAEVFSQGYVLAMRWTMLMPIAVVVLAAASCFAIKNKPGQDLSAAAGEQAGQMAGTISSPGSSGSLGQSPGSSSGTVP